MKFRHSLPLLLSLVLSAPSESGSYFAWDFYLQQAGRGCYRGGRDNGRCIRAVKY